jgi:hypothetical protein
MPKPIDGANVMPKPIDGANVMPHKGTPTFYGLKPMKDRMPHKGTPTFYGLKPIERSYAQTG